MTDSEVARISWDDACSFSPLRRYGNWRPQWFEYWDGIGTQCPAAEVNARGQERDVIDYLRRHRVLMPGDRVLDIGCGSGTFALPFARSSSGVTGIDPSGVMLSRLRSAADQAGMDNIRPLMTTWEDYCPEEPHDLVFSAFCPGIYDRRTFAKMEQASARSCCYVAGDAGQFRLLSQLWAVMSGERCTPEAWDIAYPVDYLRRAGRNPRVRRFRHRSLQRAPSREVVREFEAYFRSFINFRPTEYRKIQHYIDARSSDGHILLGEERTTWVVSWNIPA
jgi:SAM-dependent methyltransferase